MYFEAITPYVRLAHISDDKEFIKKEAICTDNRLFYILEGSGEIQLDCKAYPFAPGSIILFPRGTSYTLPKVRTTLIGLNFDYCFHADTNKRILHPVFKGQVQEPLTPEVVFEDVPMLNAPLILHDAKQLYAKLSEICEVFSKQKRFADRICSGLLIAVLSEILLLTNVPQQSENLIDTIIDYIAQNYALPLSNNDIGKKFGYHPNYINRLFLKQTGVSMHQYILNYRLAQALTQIGYTKLPITDIAQQCGFGDYAYFSRLFKNRNGISPSEYRKKSTF